MLWQSAHRCLPWCQIRVCATVKSIAVLSNVCYAAPGVSRECTQLPSVCVCVCMCVCTGGLHAVTAVIQLFTLRLCRCEQNQEMGWRHSKNEGEKEGLGGEKKKVTKAEVTVCVCVRVCVCVFRLGDTF